MIETARNKGRSRVLIAFATSYGQTERIAHFIAERLAREGVEVMVRSCDAPGLLADLSGFDAAIVGASVVQHGVQRAARRFVSEGLAELRARPTAFFQVSGAAGSEVASEREAARGIMEGFLESVGWAPAERASFAGSITYTKYPLLLRWIMKWISWRNGGSTDTSRDHEYTDWREVEVFADRFANLLRSSGVTSRAAAT